MKNLCKSVGWRCQCICKKKFTNLIDYRLHLKVTACKPNPQGLNQSCSIQKDYVFFLQKQRQSSKVQINSWIKEQLDMKTREPEQFLSSEIINDLRSIGNLYLFNEDYDEALNTYLLCLNWHQKLQQPVELSYFGILIQTEMDNFVRDQYNQGLINVYLKLIDISPLLDSVCTGIGLIIRKLFSPYQECEVVKKFQKFQQLIRALIRQDKHKNNLYEINMNILADAYFLMSRYHAGEKAGNRYLGKSYRFYQQLIKINPKSQIVLINCLINALNCCYSDQKYSYPELCSRISNIQEKVNNLASKYCKPIISRIQLYLHSCRIIFNIYKEVALQKIQTNNHLIFQKLDAGLLLILVDQCSRLKEKLQKRKIIVFQQLKKSYSEIQNNMQSQVKTLKKKLKSLDSITNNILQKLIRRVSSTLKDHSFGVFISICTICYDQNKFLAQIKSLIKTYFKQSSSLNNNLKNDYEIRLKYCQLLELQGSKALMHEQLTKLKTKFQKMDFFDHRPCLLLGKLYMSMHANLSAIDNLQIALKYTTKDNIQNKINMKIGQCYSRQSEKLLNYNDSNQIQKQKDYYNKATKCFQDLKHKKYRGIYFWLGQHYQRHFQIIKAGQYYKKDERQFNKYTFVNLARIMPQDFDKCGKLQWIIKLYPKFELAYHYLSLQYIKNNELQKAKKLFEQLTNQAGTIKDASIINNYAKVLFGLKDLSKSKQLLEKCIEQQKNSIIQFQKLKLNDKLQLQKEQFLLCLYRMNKFNVIMQTEIQTSTSIQTNHQLIAKQYDQVLQSVKKCNEIISKYRDQQHNPHLRLSYYNYLTQKIKIFDRAQTYDQFADKLKDNIKKLACDFFTEDLISAPLKIKVDTNRDSILIDIFQNIYVNKDTLFSRIDIKNQENDQNVGNRIKQWIEHKFVPFVKDIKNLFINFHRGYFQILTLVFLQYFIANYRSSYNQQENKTAFMMQLDKQVKIISKYLQLHPQFKQRSDQAGFTNPENQPRQLEAVKEMQISQNHFQRQGSKFSKNINLFKIQNGVNLSEISSLQRLNCEIFRIVNKTNAQQNLQTLLGQIKKQFASDGQHDHASTKVNVMSNYSRLGRVLEKLFQQQLKPELIYQNIDIPVSSFGALEFHDSLYQSLQKRINEILTDQENRRCLKCEISDFVRGMHHMTTIKELKKVIQLIVKKCNQYKHMWQIIKAQDNRTNLQCLNYVFKLLYKQGDKFMVCQLQLAPKFINREQQQQYQFGHSLYQIKRSSYLGSIFGCYMNLSKNYEGNERIKIISMAQRLLKLLNEDRIGEVVDKQIKINSLKWFLKQICNVSNN